MKKLVITTAVLAIIIFLLPILTSAESDMSRLNRERKKIGRALLEMQAGNWTDLLHNYTNDIEYHDPIVTINGIDDMSEFLARLFSSTPSLVTTIEDEICINDIYAATWEMEGYFTNAPYSAKGITIIKFRPKSKKVYYQRDYYTEGDIMIQIPGLDAAIEGFRTYYRCAVDPTFDCPISEIATADAVYEHQLAKKENSKLVKMNDPRSDESRLNRERKEIGRALVEIQSENWTDLLRYYTDDIEYNDPIVTIKGIDVMTQFLARLFIGSPNLITSVKDEICINGIYMATWEMEGTLNDVPYTAKGMSIVKFHPGEIQAYYSRDYYTEGDIMINIPGLDEPTQAFRTYYRCNVDPTFICPITKTIDTNPPKISITEDDPFPNSYELLQNMPNPFNPTTTIYYNIPDGGAEVTLKIYDMLGRDVITLINEEKPAGLHKVNFDASNLTSGVYIYTLQANGFIQSKKMLLLK